MKWWVLLISQRRIPLQKRCDTGPYLCLQPLVYQDLLVWQRSVAVLSEVFDLIFTDGPDKKKKETKQHTVRSAVLSNSTLFFFLNQRTRDIFYF